ncbi:MAG: ATPase [Burkholderiaceae bacterium]|nr:ATPase [Burkholderiaceae bacterium]
MDAIVINEQALLTDIEALRAQFPKTQDLYREVCVLMFFRYGITPTANKLYQYVRKGSMSAPAEALNRFWGELRNRSRVQIEHPDLPDELKTAAGELVAKLWAAGQTMANQTFEAQRQDAEMAVAEARKSTDEAQAAQQNLQEAHTESQSALSVAIERIGALEQQLAAENAKCTLLESQLQQTKSENYGQQKKLEEARRDFTAELNKIRESAQLAEERFQAGENRALLEIDRERTNAARIQKELVAVRAVADKSADKSRAELQALQTQLIESRQNAGVLEGKLHSVTENYERAICELKSIQAQVADLTSELSAARSEKDLWRSKAEDAIARVEEQQKTGVTSRRNLRKSNKAVIAKQSD